MAFESTLILCVQALVVQCVISQCTSRAAVDTSYDGFATPNAYDRIAAPYAYDRIAGSAYDRIVGPAYDRIAAPFAYDRVAAPYAYDRIAAPGLAYPGYAVYSQAMEFTPTSGGALSVTSSSSVPPTGISVMSDNVYQGDLSVAGELPFVGTTAMEGVLPTAGSGAINHACGNGVNAMSALSETSTPASVATMTGPAFGAPALAYDEFYPPAISAPACGAAYGASGFAYDGLRTPISTGLAGAPSTAYDGYTAPIEITPTTGGALPVSSASAIPPTGISVASDNVYEGALTVGGELPFVGTVATEGVVPSAGAGAVNHACGNGRNAIISDNTAFVPSASYPSAFGFNAPGFGFPRGRSGIGYGCAF